MKTLLHHSKLATTVFILFCLFFATESSAQNLFWNTNGASNTLTAANWGTTAGGPFTTAWAAGSNINFTANSAITNVTNIAVSNLTITNSSTVTWTAAGTFLPNGAIRTFDIGTGSTLIWNGQSVSTAAGTGFIKNGGGTWNIGTQGNAYPGGFTLNAGTVIFTGNNAFGTGVLNINGGIITNGNSTARTPGVTGTITIGGNFQFGDAVNVPTGDGNITFTNAIDLGSSQTRAITIGGNGVYTLGTGVMSGTSSNLIVNGIGGATGRLNLSNAANTYTGNTTITGGILRASNSVVTSTNGAFGNSANAVILNGGVLEFNNATFSRPLSVTANGSRIDAFGVARTAISANISATGTFGLTVGGTTVALAEGQDLTLTGALTDGAGTLSLKKDFTSNLTLSSASNTYSGGTVVNAGTLTLGASNALGSGIVTSDGATAVVSMGTFSDTVGTVTVNNGGNITSTTGVLTSTGTFEMKNGSADADFAGTSIPLNKTTSGAFTLNGNNTYTGATTISAGTLSLTSLSNGGATSNIGASTNAASNLVIGNATLQYNGTTTSTDRAFTISTNAAALINVSTTATTLTISGAAASTNGSLEKLGTGTLLLSGTNAYTGGTIVTAGTLTLGTSGTILDNTGFIRLNGGTLNTGTGTSNETVGVLALFDNSTLALGTGVKTLTFADSSAESWTSGKMITITGWTGGYDGTASATAGRIFVGSTAGGLTAAQEAQIQFTNPTSLVNIPAKILSTGEIVPVGNAFYAIANTAWNVTSTWSNTSGGAAATRVPVAGDIVFIGDTATLRTVTIPNSYTAACAQLTLNTGANNQGHTLTLSGSASILNVSGDVTISRPTGSALVNLLVNTGTLSVGGNLVFAGALNIANRRARLTITDGTVNVTGNIQFNCIAGVAVNAVEDHANTILMSGGAGTLNIGGAFNVPGSGGLYPGTSSTVNFNGSSSAQTIPIGVSFVTYNNLTVNNTHASGATLSAAVTATNVTGTISVGNITSGSLLNTNNLAVTRPASSAITVAAGSTFNTGTTSILWTTTGGAVTINGTFKTANTVGFSGAAGAALSSTVAPTITLGSASTIEYNAAGTQTVTQRTDYANVTLTGGSKTIAAGAITLSKTLTINTGATYNGATNNPTLTIGGDFLNNGGTFTQGSNLVTFNAAGSQTIGGTSSSTFNNLTLSGSGTKTFGIATVVSGLLTINSGVVANLGTFIHTAGSLTLNGSAQGTGSSYGGTGSPATTINTTFFAAATGVVNVGTCGAYSLTSTVAAAAVCAGSSATINVANTTPANLPNGTYTVFYTLGAPNAGSSSAVMTVSGGTGTGSFTTSALASSGSTSITIDYLTNGCVSRITSGNTATITVNAVPVGPVIAKSPNAAAVCAGATLTITVTTAGTGGAVSSQDEYRYDNGSGFSSWGTSLPSFAAVVGTNTVESRRTSTGSGCTTAAGNTVSWSVVATPVGPVITKNPNTAAVCVGATLTITVSTPGTGGTGTSQDEYRYDDGSGFTAWSVTLPSFTAVAGTNTIESRRTSTGTGCTTAAGNTVSWTVNAVPVSGTLTPTPGTGTICAGISVSATATAGSGGAGTIVDELEVSLSGGSYAAYTSGTPISTSGLTSVSIRTRRTATGSGCTSSTYNTVSWTISNANTWTGASNNTSWADAGNWTCGIAPISVTDVTIASTGGSFPYPEISSDVTINSLTINSPATLKVNANDLTVTNAIVNNSTGGLTIENSANLLQVNNVSNSGSGTTIVKRNSNPLIRLDYTLWSSPVSGQGLYAFSPFTFSNRFYKYDSTINAPATTGFYNNSLGFSISGLNSDGVNGSDGNSVPFALGKGYLIRVPWNHPTAATPTIYNGIFTGSPNNGTLTPSITDAGDSFNSAGNPYPSPITTTQLNTDNTSNIFPTLYFWRKTNSTSNPTYCTYNIATSSYTGNGQPGETDPLGVIQTGQGFLVKAKSGATSIAFNNGQRIGNNDNRFFRASANATASPTTIEAHRVWLNMTGATTGFSQTLVGYFAGASLGVDDFDSLFFNDGVIAFSSTIANTDYAIQARPLPFDAADVVAMKYKVTAAGNYTIAIDHEDGLFTAGSQIVYVRDNVTTTIHDLNSGGYTFASDAGTFDSRFEILYQLPLHVDNPTFNANQVVIYKNEVNDIVVNTGNVIMASVKIFDIRGRLLVEKKAINASQTAMNVSMANEVLLVQITSVDGVMVTKKIVR